MHNPPPRTLEQVKASLASAKENGGRDLEAKMASMMLRHGRLTDEAREYVLREYPQT